jgi:hypothetical protein
LPACAPAFWPWDHTSQAAIQSRAELQEPGTAFDTH